MNKKINTKQFERYTGCRNAESLISHIEGAYELESHFFHEADEAIIFLKSRAGMGRYEIESSSNAILSAIACIEKFEIDIAAELEKRLADEEAKAETAKAVSVKVKKQFEGDVIPSLNAAIEDLKKMSAIKGYLAHSIKYELESFIGKIGKAARL